MGKNKKDIIQLLEKIALYLEIKGENPFKISAYRKAAQALERDERSLNEITDFKKIKGIGAGTNTVIREFVETGTSETLAQLEEDVPKGLLSLLKLPGLGGKRIAQLYKELEITDMLSLKTACDDGTVQQLPGFGKKTVENILAAIEAHDKQPDRLPIAVMLPIVEKLETYLKEIPEIDQFSQAGSIRRRKETIGDLDFIIATNEKAVVKETLLQIDGLKDIIAQGDTKVSVTIEADYDVNVDFRLIDPDEFTTTLHHFTGSKDHNIAMRQLAKQNREKINEYGVIDEKTGKVQTFPDETAFFQHFGLHYIPPELRQGAGEIEAFKAHVPYIKLSDVRGDLHMHTTWSDGAQSIEEMVNHARHLGYEYIGITDHSKFLQVANGLNETRLRRQKEEIDVLNEKYSDIHIFSGVEMDILPDGSLDFSDDFLIEMDYVIGAIHSAFNQTEAQIMNRLNRALENPYVHMIAHPTGRLIGRRDGYQVNMEKVLEKAKETGTILEINANPNRFDLSSEWARLAQEMGVMLAINSDAHNFEMMAHVQYGVSVATAGWIQPETVLNTWSTDRIKAFFKAHE